MAIYVDDPLNANDEDWDISKFHSDSEYFVKRPPYQRKSVWDTQKQKELIDSFVRQLYNTDPSRKVGGLGTHRARRRRCRAGSERSIVIGRVNVRRRPFSISPSSVDRAVTTIVDSAV